MYGLASSFSQIIDISCAISIRNAFVVRRIHIQVNVKTFTLKCLLVFQGSGFVTVSHLKNDLKWEEERANRALVCDISLSLLFPISLMTAKTKTLDWFLVYSFLRLVMINFTAAKTLNTDIKTYIFMETFIRISSVASQKWEGMAT